MQKKNVDEFQAKGIDYGYIHLMNMVTKGQPVTWGPSIIGEQGSLFYGHWPASY
jgi:hypothetical protein